MSAARGSLPCPKRIRSLIFGAAIAISVGPHALAQQLRPGRLPSEVRAAIAHGLIASFQSRSDKQAIDVRRDRMAALMVPAGTPPTPFLAPGPFRATWTGFLKQRLPAEIRIHLVGRGAASLAINGKVVLQAKPGDLAAAPPVEVALVKGYNRFELQYDSPAEGDAQVRVYWAGDEFAPEPLPPEALFHDSRDGALAQGMAHRAGRLALARLNCVKCHRASDDLAAAVRDGMQELARDTPSLARAGQWLSADWIARWTLEPAQLRNETTMPRLLHALETEVATQTAADLATYVASLGGGEVTATPAATKQQVDAGMELFELRGCIACHRFTPPADEDEWGRISLHYVASKYRRGALAQFLKNSRAHYRWSRMPVFDLSEAEASALEAWLRQESKGKVEPLPAGDLERGRAAFARLGCANCHAVTEAASGVDEPQPAGIVNLARLFAAPKARGCLAEPPGAAPAYVFAKEERSAILEFLKQGGDSLARRVPVEFSSRQVAVLNCTACHTRDAVEAALPYAVLEEGFTGKHPDAIPPLTWAGEKLKPVWMKTLLAGKLGYRLRDHFETRMPAFPARAELLATGLCREHGFSLGEWEEIARVDELAQMGARIAAMQNGLACNRCHAIGKTPAQAPEQALSTNLSFARSRLRYDYYRRWMLDPLRVDKRTRMVKFSPDGRRTPLTQFYDGDARRQFNAIWHYLGRLNDEVGMMNDK
jgi:mono/diheme cytochrome c family protein